MLRGQIEVGTVLDVKCDGATVPAKVRRIGEPQLGQRSKHLWCMLTLDVHGDCVYAVARLDEIKPEA